MPASPINTPMDVRAWFLEYTSGFEPLPPWLLLKKEHSLRVAANARALSEALSWNPALVRTAEAAGILHDIGRFPQFRDHGEMSDARSVDHGELGFQVLTSEFPWEHSDLEPDLVLDPVRFHGKREIPPHCPPASLPFVRLVRDADKIDILEVIRDHIDRGLVEEIYPGTDPEGPSDPEILDSILAKNRAPTEEASSLTDLLLIKLTWVYDMNFRPTFWHVEKSGLLDWFATRLPPDDRVQQVLSRTRSFVSGKLETLP